MTSRTFDHEDDFWLLRSAEYDEFSGVLRVYIKDTDKETEYSRQAYTYHNVSWEDVRGLFSNSEARQKKTWRELRNATTSKEDPDVVND